MLSRSELLRRKVLFQGEPVELATVLPAKTIAQLHKFPELLIRLFVSPESIQIGTRLRELDLYICRSIKQEIKWPKIYPVDDSPDQLNVGVASSGQTKVEG